MKNYKLTETTEGQHQYIMIDLNQGGCVQVKLDDEGVVVDMWAVGNIGGDDVTGPIASTWSTYQELRLE